MVGSIIEIDYNTATTFLLPKHYSGRVPTVSVAFGWYDCDTYTYDHLKAVCTFGKPVSPTLCSGVCGSEYSSQVYELNRLCRVDDWNEPLSQFVSYCLRKLKVRNWIIVSYSDTGMHHHGYIYQACNFIYTGCTKGRTDKYSSGGKHHRHYSNMEQGEYRKVRTPKHRYIYFCTNSKKLKRIWKSSLKYPICEYPKGDNQNYVLGEFMDCKLVADETKRLEDQVYLCDTRLW